jgi:putative transcriptional regulator
MKEIESLRAGMLLVATPALRDPHFRRTVVYLVAHSSSDGTVGVILNRPSETAVQNVLPGWASHTARPHAVFAGGPVQTSAAMCLGVCRTGTNPREVAGVVGVTGPVVLVDLDGDPGVVSQSLRGIRIYAGRAGWDAEQLVDEIVEGSWFVVPGLPDDVLAGPRTDVWFSVLRRQPYPMSLMAYHPVDLTRN